MAIPEVRRRRYLTGLAGRISWGVADQALSSLTNFALSVAVARSVDPADFGAFSLVFVAFVFGLNVARPLATEPLAIRYSGAPSDRWRDAARAATGLVVLVGVVGSLACLPFVVLGEGILSEGFLALALTFPGLLVQDAWRFVFFTVARGRSAFLNDLIFTIVLLPALVVLASTGSPSVFAYVLIWGLAASFAALAGRVQAGYGPSPSLARSWLSEHRDLAPPLLTQRLVWVGQGQLSAYSVAAVAGLATVGILRGAELLLGPIRIATQGINLMVVPEGRRLLDRSIDSLIGGCRSLAIGLIAVTVTWAFLVALIPDTIGTQLLGELWGPARDILWPMTLATTAYVAMTAALVGMLVLAEARRYLVVGVLVSVLTLIGATAGAAIGGAWLSAAGSSVALWIGAIAAWWQLLRAGRAYGRPR